MESLLGTLAREQHQGEKMERHLGKIVHTQRNLFGPVDHEQLHWDFQHMLRSNIERAQQKWNFDFLQDVPMEGFLQWEELRGHEVPTFYHSCVVRESRRPLRHLNRPLCREEKAHRLTLTALAEKPKASKQTAVGKVPEGKRRRQTSLTVPTGSSSMRTAAQQCCRIQLQVFSSRYHHLLQPACIFIF
uniref:Cyclin-dependent kinase inhibitor domain-containing protein n=1 Tax=Phasianus colchicus TaxID=9054 RepID=A0A669PZZ9_PHACC